MKPYMKIAAAVVMIVVIIITLTYGKTPLGLESDVDTTLATLFPGLFIVTVGFIMVGITRGIYLFPAIGGVGLGFAILFEEMDTLGLITTDMFYGLTIGQLQAWCIILGLVIGGVTAFINQK